MFLITHHVLLSSIAFYDDASCSTYIPLPLYYSLRLFYAIQGILLHPSLTPWNPLKPSTCLYYLLRMLHLFVSTSLRKIYTRPNSVDEYLLRNRLEHDLGCWRYDALYLFVSCGLLATVVVFTDWMLCCGKLMVNVHKKFTNQDVQQLMMYIVRELRPYHGCEFHTLNGSWCFY